MITEREVRLAGRLRKIVGDSDDPYFASLDVAINDLEPLTAWARDNLAEDAVVLDAGGNIGLTALVLSSLAPRGRVHVFEALPANVKLMKRNLSLNNVKNCIVNAVALGDRDGFVAMHGSGSASHVAADYATRRVERGAVPMTTLDTYAGEQALDRVDFIKMDVEGFEPAVLEGAAGLVERFRPPIWMEFNSWCLTYVQGLHARDFANAIWQAFDVTVVDEAGREGIPGDGSPTRFLHDNAVLHGAVDDVLLRLKHDQTVPAKCAVSPSAVIPALALEAETLRGELQALRDSTSWRLTSPFRSLVQVIRGR